MSAQEENKALVGRFVEEVFIRASGDAIEELLTDDDYFRSHAWAKDFAIPDGPEGGGEAVHRHHGFGLLGGDYVRIEDLLAEGEKAAVRYVYEAEHTGELMGIEVTGNSGLVSSGIFIACLEEGKIAEYWRQEDHLLGLVQQLGVT